MLKRVLANRIKISYRHHLAFAGFFFDCLLAEYHGQARNMSVNHVFRYFPDLPSALIPLQIEHCRQRVKHCYKPTVSFFFVYIYAVYSECFCAAYSFDQILIDKFTVKFVFFPFRH